VSPWLALPVAAAAFAVGVATVFEVDRVILTRITRRMSDRFQS
jgi:hypothetical protein